MTREMLTPEAEQGHGPGSSGSERPWRSWWLLEPQFPLWGHVMPLRQCGPRLSPWRVETVPLPEDGQTLWLPRPTEQDARDRDDGHEGGCGCHLSAGSLGALRTWLPHCAGAQATWRDHGRRSRGQPLWRAQLTAESTAQAERGSLGVTWGRSAGPRGERDHRALCQR